MSAASARFIETRDGHVYLTHEALLQYELSQAKVINSLQAIGIKKAEIEYSRLGYMELQRSQTKDLQDLVALAKMCEASLLEIQTDFQKSTGIDVNRMTYDDKTGKITVLDDHPQVTSKKRS